jgi:penicillin G amidase
MHRKAFRRNVLPGARKVWALHILGFAIAWSVTAPAAVSTAAQAHEALAIISGEVHVAGLTQAVQVLRDKWGVAHIYAKNEHDLFFAQGVVAAQDRLFQMELWKRAGQGRLSEILGPSALARDIEARELMYRGDMRQEFESYAPDTEAILKAFTDGINAYIATLTGRGAARLPIEFRLAGFAPEPWQPRDCLNRMAAFSMTGNALAELTAARAVRELGPARAVHWFALDPPVALTPAPGLDLTGLSPELLRNLVGSDRRIGFARELSEESNNWTVSGALTASGRPLLANDPHRVLALPSLRYMVHLVAPGWNVIGAGEPGLPGVALGHNEHIAWGFTIFGLDQQDLYVEELSPRDPLEYRTEAGWARMTLRREEFRVKGEHARVIDLRFTRHGPVVWEDGQRALALRWVGTEPGTAGYLASLSVDRAQNWAQFEAAMTRWKVPSENLVYADRSGNIGEHSVGLAPIRTWTGLLPVPGAGPYDWSGFLPTSVLPHSFNPAAQFVATANNRMIPQDYPYRVGYEWAPPYRVERIRAVIEADRRAGHKLTIADMEALQNDVVSLPAQALQALVRASSLRDRPELAAFLHWDGALTRESSAAALYEVWVRAIRQVLAARFSTEDSSHYEKLRPDALATLLSNPTREFFGPGPVAARDALLLEALTTARVDLERRFGADPSKWSWGQLHTIRFRHALDQLPGAEALLDLGPLARPGGSNTVNATSFDATWEQTGGASYREILDTGDWDRSVAVNTPGQSGQPGSPHYSDLMPLWDAGQYFPLAYSAKAVEAVTTDRLELAPGVRLK